MNISRLIMIPHSADLSGNNSQASLKALSNSPAIGGDAARCRTGLEFAAYARLSWFILRLNELCQLCDQWFRIKVCVVYELIRRDIVHFHCDVKTYFGIGGVTYFLAISTSK